MSAPSPDTNITPAPESQSKKVAEPIYTYTVSWKWLLGGLICILGLGGVIGAVYFVQTQYMSDRVIKTVESMVAEADQKKEKINEVSDPEEKAELMKDSLKLRGDAANLLNNYRQKSETPNVKITEALYQILDGLYKDSGESTTLQGRRRGEQLSSLAQNLAHAVPGADSIAYRTRMLELEWDRRSLNGVIDRGKELLLASQTASEPENYEAIRYIALAFFDQIPLKPYSPSDYSLPLSTFTETMDDLLKRLNLRRPEDIEIAKRYAEFIVSLDHREPDRQKNFRACASEEILAKNEAERAAEAKACIDTMVSLNKENSAAFLARFHFVYFVSQHVPSLSKFIRPDGEQIQANEDLQTVLKLDPGLAEGLILSSMDAIRLANNAREAGDQDRAQAWEKKAEEYLKRTVKENPTDPFGYQYLGDFYLSERRQAEAGAVWNEGLKKSSNRGDEELIGRLVTVLLEQKKVEEVREKLEHLDRTITEMRYTRPEQDVNRTRDMKKLLTAQLYLAEANIAASKIDAAMRESRPAEFRRLSGIVQQKKGAAMQEFEGLLHNFGSNRNDYVFERQSVYALLLPQALLQLGELKLEWGEWDSAARYFNRARPFPILKVREMALLGMSFALQQGNKLEEATRALKIASDASPQDLSLRYAYATLLFRSQVASNIVSTEKLNDVQRELETLGERRNELVQPWALDIRLIHLGVARASLSDNAQTILDAMQEAARKFRALESQTFPPDKEGYVKNFIDDPAFVAELVGIYSSLAERSDFDRLLEKLRDFPNGEDAYFEARINDCLRRDDKNGAIAIIEEAGESPKLSLAKKDRFTRLLDTLRGGEDQDNAAMLDRAYNQLKTSFDETPETLKPQAFFLLANMALDRGQFEQAKLVRDRMEKIEGPDGSHWRYIEVRLMLRDKDPDFIRMRGIQEEVAKFRPEWDMTYVLRAMIEEQYFESNPGDPETRDVLIKNYREAIRYDNRQPEVWKRLVSLYRMADRTEDANEIYLMAMRAGVMLENRTGQFPVPYNQMFARVQEAINSEDPTSADTIARQCVLLAARRAEREELIFSLNLTLGKVFFEAEMYSSAARHLTETARRGGTYVYPLALCVAKAGKIDEGFQLLLDEIDWVPSAMPSLLPAVLLLLTQVHPSEEIFLRIDRLMSRIERGERLTLSGKAENFPDGIPIVTRRIDSRRIQSLVVRFPDRTDTLDSSELQFFSPDEWVMEEPE